MSGPKLMEIRRMRREAQRRHNSDLCSTYDSEYLRLFTRCQSLCERLTALGQPEEARLPDPARVAADAATLIGKDKDVEAARDYGETIKQARNRVADLEERVGHRIAELENRLRFLREAAAAFGLERRGAPGQAQASPLGLENLSAEDAAGIAKAEATLSRAREEFQEARKKMEGERQNAKKDSRTGDVASPGKSVAEFLAQRKAGVKTEPSRESANMQRLLAEATALQDRELLQDLNREAAEISGMSDAREREARAEGFILKAASRLRQTRQVLEWREEVFRLMDRAAPFRGWGLQEWIERLRALADSPPPSDPGALRTGFEAALRKAAARRDREEKRRALIESLRELGYEANESLEGAFAESGRLVIRRPEDDEYAIEMAADAELDRVQTSMVRYAASDELTDQQKRRDCEREESWCADHARLRKKLAERGWESDFKMQQPPGMHPVRVVVDATRKSAAKARAASPKQERRTAG
jgi:hypothetical protein